METKTTGASMTPSGDSTGESPTVVLRREMLAQFSRVEEMAIEREKRYMQRFDGADEQVKTALTASEKALVETKASTERQFETMREEITVRIRITEKTVGELAKTVSTMVGRGGGVKDSWGYLVGAGGLGAAVVGVALLLLAQ